MFCNKCGNKMEDDAAFCKKCGNRPGQSLTNISELMPQQEQAINGKNKKPTAAIVAVVAFIIIAGIFIWIQSSSADREEINMFLAEYANQYGSDVKMVDNAGETLLHKAAARWGIAVVKYLVSKGAEVNALNKEGIAPLLPAAARENYEVAKYLISKGADVNTRDNNGYTQFHRAVSGKMNTEILQFLITNGADVNAKANNKQTTLFCGTRKKRRNRPISYLQRRGC